MSGTTKTVLIVGGIAVGAFVLAKALAPKKAAGTSFSLFGGGSSGTAAGVTQGAIAGLAGLLSGNATGSSKPDPSAAAVYQPGESFDDYSTSIFGPGINPDGTGA
jgi:hypothetical protein